ncbi:MAG: hypothetical protein E5V86_14370 [Mesorhizobium sp.]|nr:MAG: hypothetical protein E5V86_14370 [Mesorhizobium sp.]
MLSASIEELDIEYAKRYSLYQSLTTNVENLIRTLLESADIEVLRIETRTKSLDSFSSKIRREGKDGKYKKLGDITDLSGIRVIWYCMEDVNRICEIIYNNFHIDKKNSTDKRKTNAPDQFGYLSVHYIVSHDARRKNLPENKQFTGMKAEIQIRTVLQHAWAVLDRRFRYNSPDEIPLAVKRKLFRIGAQLEGADEDLSDVEAKLKALRENYEKVFAAGAYKEEINRDSIAVFIDKSAAALAIVGDARASGIQAYEPVRRDVLERSVLLLVRMLKSMRLDSVDDLNQLLQKLQPRALDIFKEYMNYRSNKPLTISNYGVIRLILCFSDGDLGVRARNNSGFGGALAEFLNAKFRPAPPKVKQEK